MAAEYNNIVVKKDKHIAKIILNRPPVNVLNIEMMKEINSALEGFQKDEQLKAVVIGAQGKMFSAGVDVSDHTEDKVKEMINVFHKIFENLNRIKAPTVALVNGAALGGGCEVATFCDLVIASEKAKFGQPEIKVGVFPPIASIMFPRIMGMKKAFEMILTGETIRAEEAKEIGLVNAVLPVDNFEKESEAIIDRLASLSSTVLQLTKKSLYEPLGSKYEDAVKIVEGIYLDQLMKTEDANEGLKAFLEKREPVWKNK
jgi:cyclohexa-1,5-dienecarbonyl-CoA hydratase